MSFTLLVAVETADKNNLRKGKFILACAVTAQSVMAGKAWREHKVAGHMASTFRKQRGMSGGALPLTLSGPSPVE